MCGKCLKTAIKVVAIQKRRFMRPPECTKLKHDIKNNFDKQRFLHVWHLWSITLNINFLKKNTFNWAWDQHFAFVIWNISCVHHNCISPVTLQWRWEISVKSVLTTISRLIHTRELGFNYVDVLDYECIKFLYMY